MKIVMLQRRLLANSNGNPGTLLQNFMGSGIDYLFEPEEKGGPHICDVRNREHIKRFLSIPEGFELAETGDEAEADEAQNIQDEIDDEVPVVTEKDKHSKWPDIMTIDFEAVGPDGKKLWPVKRLRLYAEEEMGIKNANSKVEIREYAEQTYGIVFPSSLNTATMMLKALITDIQTIKAAEAEENSE